MATIDTTLTPGVVRAGGAEGLRLTRGEAARAAWAATPESPDRRAAHAFGEVLAAAADREGLDAVLRPAAAALCELVGVGRCSLYLRDARTGRYKGRLGHPVALDPLVRRLTMGGASDTLTTDVLAAARPVAVPDVDQDPRTARSVIRDMHVRSVLVVPMVHGGRVLGLAYLDDEGRRRRFSPEDLVAAEAFGVLVARWIDRSLRVAQLAVARDELARERTVLRRATLVEQRLAEVAPGTFEDVLQVVAELAGRPAEVFGPDGGQLAVRVPGGADRGAAIGPRGVALVLSQLAGADTGAARLVEPDLARGLTHRCLASPLPLEGGARGCLVLAERDTRLGPFDSLLVARAAAALAAAGRQRRTVDMARDDARALIVAQVLGEGLHAEDGAALAARLGVDAVRPRVVVTVQGPDGAADPEALVAAVAPHPAVAVRLEDDVALVVDLPEGTSPREPVSGIRDALVAALRAADAEGVVAVSAVCRDAAGLPRALRQARALVDTASGDTGDGVVGLTVDELGPARLLLTDPADAARMGEDVLGPLLDRDPSIRDLLRTLVAFFDAGSSIRATAAALDVHENTVRHRFGRVRAMTGLDIAGCVDDQLMARTALSALQIAGSAAVALDDDEE